MSIHPADRSADNPRLQCSCCGEWKRLYSRAADGTLKYRFFGGCNFTHGDHLAGTDNDVCDDCCQIACQQIAIAKAADGVRP